MYGHAHVDKKLQALAIVIVLVVLARFHGHQDWK
jgi:hypothetical protein